MQDKRVSVIVVVAGEASSLSDCLGALLEQEYEAKEILIVCRPEIEAPRAVPGTRVIRVEGPADRLQLANVGLRAGKGEVKLVLSSEYVPLAKDWTRRMAEPFQDDEIGVVLSGEVAPAGSGSFGLVDRLLKAVGPSDGQGERNGLPERDYVTVRAAAYRGRLLSDICYFNPSLGAPGGLVDGALRIEGAGYRIVENPAALVVRVGGRSSLGRALREGIEYGRSDAMLEKEHGLHWLNCGVFAAALASFLLLPLAGLSLPAGVILSGAIFVWGVLLSLRVPFTRWEFPAAAWNFVVFVVLILLLRGDWRPDLFGRRIHPAMLRQWVWLVAIVSSYLLVLAGAAAGTARRVLRQPGGLRYLLPVGALSLGWWLSAGLGYVCGAVGAKGAKDEV